MEKYLIILKSHSGDDYVLIIKSKNIENICMSNKKFVELLKKKFPHEIADNDICIDIVDVHILSEIEVVSL